MPKSGEVSAKYQAIFDNLKKSVGFIPNIYATYAFSENALERYMVFANGAASLNKKEKEVVNLVVSQINKCRYCLAAHTAIGKMNGFTDDQILAIGEKTITNLLHSVTNVPIDFSEAPALN